MGFTFGGFYQIGPSFNLFGSIMLIALLRVVSVHIYLILFSGWLCLVSPLASADPRHRTAAQGDVPFEDTSVGNVDLGKRGAIRAGAWLEKAAEAAKQGTVGNLPPIEEDTMGYLAVMYLYCSVKLGTCTELLETILDSDVRLSKEKSESQYQCPTMTRFWKAWVDSDLEERAKFHVEAAAGMRLAQFNSSVRPKFVNCKLMVKEILTREKESPPRYGPDGAVTRSAAKTFKFFQTLNAAGVDIFGAMGLRT